jgi:cysteinyl-tRNA synthetase
LIAENQVGRRDADKIIDFLKSIDRVIGVLDFAEPHSDVQIDALIKERNNARARKDWKKADEIRAKLSAMGIQLEDTAEGTRWKRTK